MKNEILKNWIARSNKAQTGHYIASEFYKKSSYTLGILLVVTSTFVTATIYFIPESISSKNLIVIVSIISTITAGIQTLFRPQEKSELHRISAAKYGELKREIEIISLNEKDSEAITHELIRIKKTWDNIAEHSPLTPQFSRKKSISIIEQDILENSIIKKP